MLWIWTEVAESKRVEAFHDAVEHPLANVAVNAPVGLLSKGNSVVVLHRKGDRQSSMLSFLEVEPICFRRQPTRQTQMRVLVHAHGNHDRAKASEVIRLRVQNVPGLDQRCLNVGQVGLALEAVNGLKFGEVGAPPELEPKPLNDRPRRLEVDLRPFRIKSQRSVICYVLLEGDFPAFFEANTPRRLAFQIGHGDGDVAAVS